MKKVLLFLSRGFEEIEASAFSDIMGWSREHGNLPVSLDTAGLHPARRSAWGLDVRPRFHLEELRPDHYHALAIPGRFESAGYDVDALFLPLKP